MPAASTSYNYSRGLTTEAHLKYINDALSAVPTAVSFAGVDVLFVIPAKYANEISSSTSTAVDVTAPDGSVIGASVTIGQDMYNSWGYKTINHEAGHTIGLPDLYPYGDGEVTKWVGGFDIMGLISGQSPDFFAWHKWQLGWVGDEQIDCITGPGKTTHQISPIEVNTDSRDIVTKALAVPLNGTSYLIAEVRSNLGVNKDACGTGVLLYTADTALGSGDGPVRVLDTKPSSGGCGPELGRELNDAPLLANERFDTGLGVIISVLAQDGEDYVVEVVRDI
jgi:M6 family metalloprotease-like protein